MTVRKLTAAEMEANRAARLDMVKRHDEAMRAEGRNWWGYPEFPARPEVYEALKACDGRFTVKSGVLYQAHTTEGEYIVRVYEDGRERICATQLRGDKLYGPIRSIDVNNSSLIG